MVLGGLEGMEPGSPAGKPALRRVGIRRFSGGPPDLPFNTPVRSRPLAAPRQGQRPDLGQFCHFESLPHWALAAARPLLAPEMPKGPPAPETSECVGTPSGFSGSSGGAGHLSSGMRRRHLLCLPVSSLLGQGKVRKVKELPEAAQGGGGDTSPPPLPVLSQPSHNLPTLSGAQA